MIGGTFSHYRVLEKIGSGGMGDVYRATDIRLGRSVALKFLPEHLAGTPQAISRFRREAQAASALNHPNICTIYDIGQAEGKAFIVMELLEGQTLQDRLGSGPLARDDFFDIAVQIGDALEAAHARGIVHRDLKPTNIFVTQRNGAKILDFGVAKVLGFARTDPELNEATVASGDAPTIFTEPGHLTNAGMLIGTVAYMSPEQARGDDLDARTDIFSFGAVLYEMATGRPAFSRKSLAATFDALLNETVVPPSRVKAELSAEFDSVVSRALAKERDQRYPTISALIADVRALRQNSRIGSTTLRPQMPSCAQAADFADSIAVIPFENAGADAGMEYLSDGITEAIINRLARFRQLRVVPRATVFRYRENVDPLQAGRELHVHLVLTGRVVQSGETFTLNAELVDVSHDSQVWGERYKRNLADLFSLQEEIVAEISKSLRFKQDESVRAARVSTPNRDAYHLLVKGTYYAHKWSPENLAKGLNYAREAIESDPAYAEPYALLAYVYSMLGYFGVLASKDAFPKARAAGMRALELDDSIAGVYFSLAIVRFLYDWDWAGAEADIQRGLRLAPNDANGQFLYGEWLLAMGRLSEALPRLERALDLDPLSTPISVNLAAIYYFNGQTDRALEQIRKTKELDPSFVPVSAFLAVLLARTGHYEEAIAEALECMSLSGSDLRWRGTLAVVYAIAGRTEEALEIAASLEAEPRIRKLNSGLPYIYGALGEHERALAFLEEAYDERVSNLVFICRAPELKSVHQEPRFVELIRRIGLPPPSLSASAKS